MAAIQQVANLVGHSLASPATAGATVLTWDSVAGWPTLGNFMILMRDPPPATTFEWVECTAVNVGANQTTVTRGQENSTAIAHATGSVGANELSAAMLLRLTPLGTLGYAQVTAAQTGITGFTDLTGLTVTVTCQTARRIHVTGFIASLGSTVAGDNGSIYISEGATQLQQVNLGSLQAANGPGTMIGIVLVSPSAGVHTYKMVCQRTGGTGSLTMYAATVYPAWILCEDIGAS